MRIGFLTQYYPPEIGAPQARLSNLAAHCVAHGHDVTVLTGMPSYPAGRIYPGYGGVFSREEREGVDVVRTWVWPTQRTAAIPRLANYVSFAISSATIGPWTLGGLDYLLVESPPLFLGPTAWFLSWLRGARLIFNVSDLWPESAVRLGALDRGSLSYRAMAILERECYRRAWLITGQSASILADITARFPERATWHLSNGVDVARFSSDGKPDVRSTMASGAETIALYAGLHGLAQGLGQILDAAERLEKKIGLRLVLIGDGPEKQTLQARAVSRSLDNVTFLDARPHVEMPAYLASADIAVITLKTDLPGAVPSKLYEAMAAAKPIVLVASGEAADIVRTHQAGIVVSPGDVDGLSAAILTLHENPRLAREFGAHGRRAAETHFDRAAIAARFIEFLEEAPK